MRQVFHSVAAASRVGWNEDEGTLQVENRFKSLKSVAVPFPGVRRCLLRIGTWRRSVRDCETGVASAPPERGPPQGDSPAPPIRKHRQDGRLGMGDSCLYETGTADGT
jgi:hypothetical protein